MKSFNRRGFLFRSGKGAAGIFTGMSILSPSFCLSKNIRNDRRPNILFIMSDDQSWVHAGAYGCKAVNTPAFDRIAEQGVLFTNVFSAAPNCAPSRASILTGRYPCELEEAGSHFSNFPKKFRVYPDILESKGYQAGFTGKGWGPGNWKITGWPHNPAGREYNKKKFRSLPYSGIHKIDCAANFRDFLNNRDKSRPFCFWIGSREPHGPREKGSGLKAGKKLKDVIVPLFLPDTSDNRSKLLDYFVEIEWFDKQVNIVLKDLEEAGELNNTLIVITSDNGMPFPRGKANLYEYGTHMPMAVQWPEKVKAGRNIDDLVSFTDLGPTFLEAAGIAPDPEMSGKSFLNLLFSAKDGRIDPIRKDVLSCMERHSHQRYDNLGYPMRSIRTYKYLYIRNFKPDRWPLGDPKPSGKKDKHYPDTEEGEKLYELAYAKRPAEELYDIQKDTACLHNLAGNKKYADVKAELSKQLETRLIELKDPRMLGYGDIFESYPRYGKMKKELGGFSKKGEYNPKYQKKPPSENKK